MHLNSAFGACCVIWGFCSLIPDALADSHTVTRCINQVGEPVVIRYDEVGGLRRVSVDDPVYSRNFIFRGRPLVFSSVENEAPGIQQFAGFHSGSIWGAWVFPNRSSLQFQYVYRTKVGQLMMVDNVETGPVAWRSLYSNCEHSVSR
jgi:hypothetical protein